MMLRATPLTVKVPFGPRMKMSNGGLWMATNFISTPPKLARVAKEFTGGDRRPSLTILGDEPLHLYGRSPVADETDVTIV